MIVRRGAMRLNWIDNMKKFNLGKKNKKSVAKNISFSKEIDDIVEDICEGVVDFCINKTNSNVDLGKAVFPNPYNKEESIEVLVFLTTKSDSESAAEFNIELKTLLIYPYSVYDFRQAYDDEITKEFVCRFHNSMHQLIVHEIVHTIDPKLKIKKYIEKIKNGFESKEEYFNSDPEFDAYCKQISDFIKINANEEEIGELYSWLRSSNITNIPYILSYFEKIILFWANDISKINKLKERIYTDLNAD